MPKPPSKDTIPDLQSTCVIFAHLSGQFQVDVRQLKSFGLKWLACHFKKWYGKDEDQLRLFIDRILYFGEDPEYDSGKVSGADSVTEVLERAERIISGALDTIIDFRKSAYESRMDYTCDLYEHAIEVLENQLKHVERELHLLAQLGENDYIAARLEDA